MKIVYYSYDHVANPYCGGGGAYRDLTINTLLASRHEIHCYCGRFRGAHATVAGGLRVSFLGSSFNYLISRISNTLVATVHCLFVKADVIVICYSIFSPVLAFMFRKKNVVLELFHLARFEPFRKYSVLGILPYLFEQCALLFGRNIICINHGMADYISRKYKNKNIATVYTGFDSQLLSKQIIDEKYILYMGRIDIHMKGIDVLIDSVEKIVSSFPGIRMIVAGRGSRHDTDWLRNRIRNSPAAGVMVFRENVSDAEKISLFHGATFVCMPSRFEGWCIAAIEAAASSKATIGTRIMGLEESILDRETGLLVSPENPDELAEAMATLLRDADLRTRLGGNGYRRALGQFTWDAIARQQEKYYLSCVKNAGRTGTTVE
jgi:glycosyltransferase involved in cell wall biosynthesis